MTREGIRSDILAYVFKFHYTCIDVHDIQSHLHAFLQIILLTAFVEGVREEYHVIFLCVATASDFGEGANLECSKSRVNSQTPVFIFISL